MIIKLSPQLLPADVNILQEEIKSFGMPTKLVVLFQQPVLIAVSTANADTQFKIAQLSGVEEIIPFDKEYKLASRAFKQESTSFNIKGQTIGGNEINVVAGPCSIENEDQIFAVAEFLSNQGVKFIRGGAYKPRTSPYRFQGLGHEGLKLIKKAADAYGLLVVTEIIDSSLIDEICEYADILQVGSRNMMNFFFLKQLGKIDKPVLLKRGMYARVEEWLMAAEYILSEGNEKVILCERGIRTFDNAVRNTFDIAAIPLIKSMSHLPIWADPSHGTGRRDLIIPCSLASVAAGADGLVVEIHPNPEVALSDGAQSLYLEQFAELLQKTSPVAEAVGRTLDIKNKTFYQ
ncbi:MAG: 3-deoxy-7-phosphoheptulonate synthase [Chitinophagaceae bacterium]|nr:MAG: 3-deoxy-7-phosphoheptulonate synthase [Chitinophagaceae bacterium]